MRLKQGQDAGHGGEDRDALAADELDEARRGEAAFEMELGGEDGRNPEAHGLAEDVAERQRVQNAQRMDEPLVAHVGLGAFFDGPDAGEHIAVREHDAFGVAGGAGGEENLRAGFRLERPEMAPASSAGSSVSQSSKASVGMDAAGTARRRVWRAGGHRPRRVWG